MRGINLNKPVTYKHASLRFFHKNECHITRYCDDDVLVMVFDGVLRFSEDGICFDVHPGEYHIQRANLFQEGYTVSDSPQYLYVHFHAEWDESNEVLPFRGSFDYEKLRDIMIEMDRLSHGEYNYTQKCAKFYEILTELNNKTEKTSTAHKIAEFIEAENGIVSLEQICKKFIFSKNHIINIFKKEYGITPVKYINNIKIKRAKYLLEVTSDTAESIALESGFNDYSHFYKLFYRKNGISPTEWRRQKQISPFIAII